MRNFKKLFFLSLFFVLYACFNQVDTITISKSGKIKLVSTIEITVESEKDVVKDAIKSRIKTLKDEGWKVSYKWEKRSKPYQIKVTASNTLQQLYEYQSKTKKSSSFGVNIYKKFSDKRYAISFDILKDANNRILNLNKKSLPLYRIGENDKLYKLRNIKSKTDYYVLLDK